MDVSDPRAVRESAVFRRAAQILISEVFKRGFPSGLSFGEMLFILHDPRPVEEALKKALEEESSQPSEPREEAT